MFEYYSPDYKITAEPYPTSNMYRLCKFINLADLCFFQGGVSSGYKKLIADKGLPDETYTTESIALIRISGTAIHNNKIMQVDAVSVH